MDLSRTGDYRVTFVSRHSADKHFYNNISRWWLEWNEYYLDEENFPVYGSCMLLNPNRKPNLTQYMLWTDSVHLLDPIFFIH